VIGDADPKTEGLPLFAEGLGVTPPPALVPPAPTVIGTALPGRGCAGVNITPPAPPPPPFNSVPPPPATTKTSAVAFKGVKVPGAVNCVITSPLIGV
jgi:hypothetical protein